MNSFLQNSKIVCLSIFMAIVAIGITYSPTAGAQSACRLCEINAQDKRDICDNNESQCNSAVAIILATGGADCAILAFVATPLVGGLCAAFFGGSAGLLTLTCSNNLLACRRGASVYLRDCLSGCGANPNLQVR